MLERGERLESLDDKSEVLASSAVQFKAKATKLKVMLLYLNHWNFVQKHLQNIFFKRLELANNVQTLVMVKCCKYNLL